MKTLNSRTTELRKKHFFCRKDAEQAALEWATQTAPYHQLTVEIVECPRYASGRPKKDTPRIPLAIEYELTATILEKEPAIARARQMIGCFVLLTNVPTDKDRGYDAEKILRTYKDQHGIENNFGFLKDDQIVNAIFLKRAERIEVLGLILLLSLLVWRLMEHTMRTTLKDTEETLPRWDDKPTQCPTSYMMTWKFKGIIIIRVGQQPRLAKPLSTTQKAFLHALKVPESCFY